MGEVTPTFLEYAAENNGKVYVGTMDYGEHTITVEVDEDVNLQEVTILFIEYPGVSSVKIGDVEQVSETVMDCRNPLTYTLTTVNGLTENWTVTVKYHEVN